MTDREQPGQSQADERMPKLRVRLGGYGILRLLVIVLVVCSALAMAGIAVKEGEVQRTVHTQILLEEMHATRGDFTRFFTAVSQTLETIRRWGASGLVRLDEPQRLNDLLIPLIDPQLAITALVIADQQDASHSLLREPDGWVDQIAGQPAVEPQDTSWFRQAAAQPDRAEASWSTAMSIATDADEAIGAWVTWRAEGGRRVIAACQVRQRALDKLVSRGPTLRGSIAMLLTKEHPVLWISGSSGSRLRTARGLELLSKKRPEYAVMSAAIKTWGGKSSRLVKPLRLTHENERWWAVFDRLRESPEAAVVGLLVPAEDLQERLHDVMDWFTYILLGLIFACIATLVVLAFVYRRRLQRLTRLRRRRVGDEAGLRALISSGEGDGLEFKSTMRRNLKTNKQDKAIELAWLKTVVAYLNSAGGALLIGVQDDGSVLGTEADGFKNEDKLLLHFNNLVGQHIGFEFAKYIRTQLTRIDGQVVLVVECESAARPAYLRTDKDDDFYVRVGPSSRKLPASKIIDYLKTRSVELA